MTTALLEGVPWEVLGGLLAGIAALITAMVAVPKVLAEMRQLRHTSSRTAADTEARLQEVVHELRPNHGGSTRDAINRIEALVQQNSTELAALRDDVADVRQTGRRHDRELARANSTLGQLGVRITSTEARLADQLDDHSQRLRSLESLEINRSIPNH